MPLAVKLNQYLNRQGATFQAISHDRVGSLEGAVEAASVAKELVVRTTLAIDAKGVVMLVHPMGAIVDLQRVNRQLRRQLQALTAHQVDRIFGDCEPGSHPPVGAAYRIETVLDHGMNNRDLFIMQSGCHTTLLQMDGRAFRLAMSSAQRVGFCDYVNAEGEICDEGESLSRQDITLDSVARKLQKLYRLPPMPAVATRILSLVSDDESTVQQLSQVIEQDPSLAAQIMRYSRSALFNYPGEIATVQDAVNIVLGFERVAHIAMGIAASKAFNIPGEGPLGLDNFWRHALYASFLSQQLARHVPADKQVDPGIAYLAGLLHNFGVLLLGHLFPPEFKMLNKLVEADPEQPMTTHEKQVFGMGCAQDLIALGHGAVGGILLRLWNLPEEIVKTAGMHQCLDYQGEHENYVKLVQLCNELLKPHGIGDELNLIDPEPLMLELGLDPDKVAAITESLFEKEGEELEHLVRSLAA